MSEKRSALWWIIPVGCLLLLSPCLCIAVCSGGAVTAFLGSLPQAEMLELAEGNPVAREKLGTPMELGWAMEGNNTFDDDGQEIDISLPISGPNGEGRIHVDGAKVDDQWTWWRAYIVLDSGERIDLLDDSESSGGAESTLTHQTHAHRLWIAA